ncbi:MAG: ZIP family metal transporter [Gammaproteobacteria bacterium]|nr:ZIP family metal transporter [Gammaproteobacteria bacterium]
MTLLLAIILFTALGGVLGAVIASLFLLLSDAWHRRLLPHLISFAVGALLGAAFLALLPHAMELAGNTEMHRIGLTFVVGILIFFILEKLVIWRHCHHDECVTHAPDSAHHHPERSAGALILIGDGLHNLVDGVLIATAFLTDFHLGVVTALAVAAHEIPQEVGDVAVLLQSGMSRGKAFLFNILASLTSVLGGIAAYFALETADAVRPYVLAIAAGSFVYVAVADLIPGLHKRTDLKGGAQQVIMIFAGLGMIMLGHSLLH